MIKKLMAAGAATLLAGSSAMAQEVDPGFSHPLPYIPGAHYVVGAATDMALRGISIVDKKGAASAGFEYVDDTGVFVGAHAANVKFTNEHTGGLADGNGTCGSSWLGYNFKPIKDTEVWGLIRGMKMANVESAVLARTMSQAEIGGAYTFNNHQGGVGAKVVYSNRFLFDKAHNDTYVQAFGQVPVGVDWFEATKNWKVGATVGYTHNDVFEYGDYKAYIGRNFANGVSVQASYIGTYNNGDIQVFNQISDKRAVLSASYAF